jgi:16S rRNA U1498 N3-methylase RsmE
VLLLALLIGHQKGLSDAEKDALDRFRLGPNALNVNMLRTEEAHRLVDFVKYLLQKSSVTNS